MKKKRKQEKQSNFQEQDTKKFEVFQLLRLCHGRAKENSFYLPSAAFFVNKFEFPT